MTRRGSIMVSLLMFPAYMEKGKNPVVKAKENSKVFIAASEPSALLHVLLPESNNPALLVSFRGETVNLSSEEIMQELRKK
jgi:hypothetical protein